MIKLKKKHGFTLSETAVVIAILGCLIVFAVGMFNYSNLKYETIAIKQTKMESALKAATLSIIGNDKLTPQQACSPEFFRDKYAEKLNGATVIDDVSVNGEELPALKVANYGVVAVSATDDCENKWAAGGAIFNNDITPTIDAVAVYAIVDDNATSITVPANATASNITPTNPLSFDTMAFAVNSKGISNTYTSAASTPLTAALPEVKAGATPDYPNHDINICNAGSAYSYISTACQNREVKFYELINESNCQVTNCPGNGVDYDGNPVLTGQINLLCKLGNGSAGQCSCPPNKKYWAGLYVTKNSKVNGICLESCDELGMIPDPSKPNSNNCVCPEDKPDWDANLQQCIKRGTCDEDYLTWNELKGTCVCKTKAELLALDPNYFGEYEQYDGNSPATACKACTSPRSINSENKCVCDASKVQLTGEEIFKPDAPSCKYDCAQDDLIANPDRTRCLNPDCGCLKKFDPYTATCVCDPTQASDPECMHSDEKYDPSSSSCKSCKSPNREYNDSGVCICKAKSELTLAANEIYDPTAENCIYVCKDGAVANADHTQCIGDCLEEYDYANEELKCIENPSDAKILECLEGTNYVSNPDAATCKDECTGLTAPDQAHKTCPCDESKVATALNQTENLNKIYDLTNAPVCMKPCTGQTFPETDRMTCRPVDCLYETTDNITQHCKANPTDAETQACLAGTNAISAPSATANKCRVDCTGLTAPDNVHKICNCDEAKVTDALNQTGNLNKIYDLNNAPTCMAPCTGQTYPNTDRKSCKPVDCLYETTDNITQHCIANPTDAQTVACLQGTNYISNIHATGCKSECNDTHKPNDVYKACICKAASELHLADNEIYDPTGATCVYVCKDGARANADHTQCIGACLEEYDYVTETLNCIKNPSDVKILECLEGTNYVSNPDAATCKDECTGLTAPDHAHKMCACDLAKVTTALKETENLNKIYDLTNAPTCMKPCTGQTFPETDRMTCRPVDCLYETTDNITQHCKANPTDAETQACLAGTNAISDPSATANKCRVDCTGLTAPDNVHKMCACDLGKVTTALNQPENLNKIYDMSNAPACMMACTGQTFPQTDRYACRPVDCLYETTDNITQHCKSNPTDEETRACLVGTNNVSSPSSATCREDCGLRRSPNYVYKVCECSLEKMRNQYSAPNMRFDATSATCEVRCPSNFTFRNPQDATTCVCPTNQPAEVTVQSGYYYDPSSPTLSGSYACQLECPKTQPQINDWIAIHAPLFNNNKVVYDSTKAGCITECQGNYIASTDKLSCICGIGAASCAAGTYYSQADCACLPCTTGHYCPGGTDEPIECPCGTYGSTTHETTAACTGVCQAGYYCPKGSTSATQIQCAAGYRCPAGTCEPEACTFPATSVTPFTSCDKCRTEAEIKATNPNYFKENEIWVDNVSLSCKKCKSNMVYKAGVCACPDDKPNWTGTECIACQPWTAVYFARQGEYKAGCTLYDHLLGKKGACFDYERVPSQGMITVANQLSQADKNRTFNGVYAYMVAQYANGTAKVVGVFSTRSWYHTFPTDDSSVNTARSQQAAGSCAEMCGGNAECEVTCNVMKYKVTKNTMFNNCQYAVKNQYLGQTFNNASDELCTGGSITIKSNNNECTYTVGGILRNVTSPIVLDLKGNGFKFTSVKDGVVFDLNNDGVPEQTAWTRAQKSFDDAFLVLDKNKNGQVDNGGELFGDQNGSENGFLELAKYDDNGDKLITEKDKIYNQLLLWVDFNKNAKVDYEADGTTKEFKTLKEAGVTELSVDYKVQKDQNGNILKDIYGNITGFIGQFKMMVENVAGKVVEVVRKMMDVFFVTQ